MLALFILASKGRAKFVQFEKTVFIFRIIDYQMIKLLHKRINNVCAYLVLGRFF